MSSPAGDSDTLGPGDPSPTRLRLLPWTEARHARPVDYHMHTLHTDGAATVDEMAKAAASGGIDEILFSEHVRHTSTYYPAFVDEVRDLKGLDVAIHVGIETKILDADGHLDCSPEIASMCDGIVGSVHGPPAEENRANPSWSGISPQAALALEFQLAMAIITKSQAHILGHPMGIVVTRYKLLPMEHLQELARACLANDKAFELNPRYCANAKDWVDIVQRVGCKVSFGSDAHDISGVGRAWTTFILDMSNSQ